jgi:hypothetical protein
MAMTKTQQKYACDRVRQKAEQLRSTLKKELTTGKPLTCEDRAKLLRAGKVKLRKDVNIISTYTDVVKAFDFSPFEPKVHGSYKRRAERISETERKAIDEIMLGDADVALRVVREFTGDMD